MFRALSSLVVLLSVTVTSSAAPWTTVAYTYVGDHGDSLTGGFSFRFDSAATHVFLSQGFYSFSASGVGGSNGKMDSGSIGVQTTLAYGGMFPLDPTTGQLTDNGNLHISGDLFSNFVIDVRFAKASTYVDWEGTNWQTNTYKSGSGHWDTTMTVEHCEPSSLVLGLIGTGICLLRTRRSWKYIPTWNTRFGC